MTIERLFNEQSSSFSIDRRLRSRFSLTWIERLALGSLDVRLWTSSTRWLPLRSFFVWNHLWPTFWWALVVCSSMDRRGDQLIDEQVLQQNSCLNLFRTVGQFNKVCGRVELYDRGSSQCSSQCSPPDLKRLSKVCQSRRPQSGYSKVVTSKSNFPNFKCNSIDWHPAK